MTSTEVNLGLAGRSRPSSRVLKPPGGGHSNIFAESDVKPNPPRPKYDQQNSSNLNFVMNTADPNESVVKKREELRKTTQKQQVEEKRTVDRGAAVFEDVKRTVERGATAFEDTKRTVEKVAVVFEDAPPPKIQQQNESPHDESPTQSGRVRVPPGGFSSGLW